jgi:putative copper export protein
MIWTLIRFVHVLGAALWVGGQLALSLVVLPIARRRLSEADQPRVLTPIGRRFGLLTLVVMLPLQVATGVGLAVHHGVTWASLAEPGYGRVLAAKLGLVIIAMGAAGLHGVLTARGRPAAARTAAITGLTCSVGIILLATALAG